MNEKDAELDRKAVAWLVDCIMADARDEGVSRFSEYIKGHNPKNLNMRQLLSINDAVCVLINYLYKEK